MNRINKMVMFALLLSVIPARIWAQDYISNHVQAVIESHDANLTQNVQIRDYENGFLFNVFEIDNVEERVQLASALATSDIWLCNPTDNPGELFIRPNSYYADIPIYAEFDYLRMTLREEYEEVSLLPKEEFAEVFNSWAHNISNDYYNFLISDHLDRANHCMDAEPFCTSDVYNFPANNSGYSWSGPNYGCLGSSPTNKHSFWYYMRIGVAGNITIKIEAPFDVDFALWGPFSNQTDPCPTAAGQAGMLTANCSSCPNNTSNPNFYPSGNLHDCSFSIQSYEYAHVVNGQVGQYFILLITNYNGGSGNITFQKYAGDGETDCGILPPLVDNDGPYCVGQTIHLTANGQAGASYSWSGPGGFTSNQQNPTRPNCTMNMAGTYTCTITLGGASNSATTEVVIYPQPTANFNFTTVCQGNPTQFTSTSTTNPSGQQMTYQWNFGDGQTSTQQNPSHQYANAGTYTVTLAVGCGNGLCTHQISKTVTVYAEPAANAGPDQTIPYGSTAQLSGSGGAGTFNFHWEPANMVTNPNAQNTQTVALTQDQTYTLTVTNPQGDCTSTDEVTIHISGSAMTVTALATPPSICLGSTTQLQANAGGGTGNFNYSWTPTTGLSNPNVYNPTATPTETTTYTCVVSDGQTSQTVTVTVTVNFPEYTEEEYYICPGGTYTWNGQTYSDEGDYDYLTTTDQGCEKIITLHLHHYPTYDETTIEAEICSGETYDFFGTTYDHSCYQMPHTLQSVHGCDSIVRLNLTVWPENGITEHPVSLCPEQLPFYYEEDPNQIPLYAGLHIFHLEDIHGCDSTVWVDINVSDYYMPPIVSEYVCYETSPSFDWYIPEANTTITYTTEGQHIDTLHTSACDGIFRLDLHFQQIPETIVEDVVTCDSYTWYMTGQTYTQSGDYYHSVSLYPFPCEQVYQLHLTINTQSLLPDETVSGACDAVPVNWFGQDTVFTANTVYKFTGLTDEGCYREQTYHIENMHYTPNPTIECSDLNVEFPHYPITATEFNVNRYTYYAFDPQSETTWNNSLCEWSISKPSWRIVPSDDNRSCTVYAMDWVADTVWLTFKATNPCSGSEGILARYWLKPSFFSVEENESYPAAVSVIPNPNNGQMELRLENMEGKISVRVCNATGALIDSFEFEAHQTPATYSYAMKRIPNGVYFFTFTDGKRSITKKVVIIH